MRRWGIVGIVLLCLVLVGVVSCTGDQSQQTERQLVEVVRGDLTVIVSVSGNINVVKDADLAFIASGRIARVYVDDGDRVLRGDALVELDTGALELALMQAKVGRDEAEYNLNQLRDVLHASYDQVRIAEAQLAAAEKAAASSVGLRRGRRRVGAARTAGDSDGGEAKPVRARRAIPPLPDEDEEFVPVPVEGQRTRKRRPRRRGRPGVDRALVQKLEKVRRGDLHISELDELSDDDKLTVARARKLQRFLSQPFHVAEQFTGTAGVYVRLEDTIRGFKEILDGKHDELPEQAFYMVGTIEEALAKAAKLA